MHPFAHIQSFVHSLFSPMYSLLRPHSMIHSFIHALTNSPIHTFIKFINSLFHCTYSFLHCVHSFLHRFIGDAGGEGRLLRHRGPGHQARRRHAHHEEGHGWRSSGLYPRFPFVFVVFLCICVCASMFFNPCFFHP